MTCKVVCPTYITTYQFGSTTHIFNYSSTNPFILPPAKNNLTIPLTPHTYSLKTLKHPYIHSLQHSISHTHTFTHSCSRSPTHSLTTRVNQPHTRSFAVLYCLNYIIKQCIDYLFVYNHITISIL